MVSGLGFRGLGLNLERPLRVQALAQLVEVLLEGTADTLAKRRVGHCQ